MVKLPYLNKTHIQEAVVQKCSVKKLFSAISQNSQENTSAQKLDSGTGVFLWILWNF